MKRFSLILITSFFSIAAHAMAAPPSNFDATAGNVNGIINGASPEQQSGYVSTVVGDVNGDGIRDIAVTAPSNSPANISDAGSVYVVFGGNNLQNVDLANLGNKGFRIDGVVADTNLGVSVANAGDVNGDGKADLIIGASNAENGRGVAYIVLGKADTGSLAVSSSSIKRISGVNVGDRLGASVSGGVDVNNDGKADVVIGAPRANGGNGAVYVVTNLANDTSAANAYQTINGVNGGNLGKSVSLLPRSNGAAVLAGAPLTDRNGKADVGEAYLLGVTSGSFNANAGAVYYGASAGDLFGASVAYGDVNGDGNNDILIGANGRNQYTGSAYVFYAQNGGDASSLSNGARYDGAAVGDQAGISIAAADINNDGKSDVLIGAYSASTKGRTDNGASYIVYGGQTSFSLSNVNQNNGFRIDGPTSYCQFGVSVSGGDVNGDGLVDLVSSGHLCSARAGVTIIFFGWKVPPPPVVDPPQPPIVDPPQPPVVDPPQPPVYIPPQPPVIIPPTPPVEVSVPPEERVVVPTAKARIKGKGGCARKKFTAYVKGKSIKSVKWKIDKRTIKTVKKPVKKGKSKGQYRIKINPKRYRYGVHRVTATVVYVKGASKKKETLKFSFQHCRKKVVQPRTTG